jgi:effector-binding domain-containing protein
MRTSSIETRVLPGTPVAIMRATLTVADLPAWLGMAFGRTAATLGRRGMGPAGPPFARYHRLADERFEVEAGFPAAGPVGDDGDVIGAELPGGPAAVTVHVGPYDEMGPTYAALEVWISDHGFEADGDAWEVYFSDPQAQPDPDTWRTEVVQPYRG